MVAFATEVPLPDGGPTPVRLELDLVSEGVIWFAEVRGHPIEIRLDEGAPTANGH